MLANPSTTPVSEPELDSNDTIQTTYTSAEQRVRARYVPFEGLRHRESARWIMYAAALLEWLLEFALSIREQHASLR